MVNTRKWTNRKKKYRGYESSTFVLHNANPKLQITGDCVFRALATALEKDYDEILHDLFEMQLETGHCMDDIECYGEYLKRHGFKKCKQPRKSNNTKYTGEQFCKYLMKCDENSCIFAHIGGGHAVAIKDCKIHDTWYSARGSIGNYWIKK